MRLLVSGSVGLVAELSSRYHDLLGYITTPTNFNGPATMAAAGLPWAADNGCFQRLDAESFISMVECIAELPDRTRLLWVVCPDVVANARATLALWPWWSAVIRAHGLPVAFVLQDGQENEPLPDADAYFIGGSTAWKLGPQVARIAWEIKRRGRWLHMGRVNSMMRIRQALALGCDSVDGSSYSKWSAKALKHRPDMSLERHLRFMCGLEKRQQEQQLLF